jgi:hypothetical protein
VDEYFQIGFELKLILTPKSIDDLLKTDGSSERFIFPLILKFVEKVFQENTAIDLFIRRMIYVRSMRGEWHFFAFDEFFFMALHCEDITNNYHSTCNSKYRVE